MSKIEEKFARLFTSADIAYVREKTFPDLKNGMLRYDFYLPKANVLVEIDSMLHFKMVPKYHKDEHEFKHAQQNDRLKNSYALSHKIQLYRIPEWDFTNIHRAADVFKPQYLVLDKWHNDKVYRKYLKGQES